MKELHIKDNTYFRLSANAYDFDKVDEDETIIKNSDSSNQTFKIQASRVDKVNGFQAMAVSPKDSKGNVDNETVYFVYAGTDKYEPADINTDIYI